MFEGLLFILAVFIVFYLPGRFVLKTTKFSVQNFSSFLSLSLTIGISLFLFVTYALAWIKLDYLYNFLLLIPIIFFCKEIFSRSLSFPKIKKENLIFCLIILFGSICMVYTTWFSGLVTKEGMTFYNFNAVDSISHLGVIENLTEKFPPTHPGLAGIPFRGYHFFYDFILANFIKYYHFSLYNLFFRYFSVLLAILYGLSGLAAIQSLKASRFSSLIFILLLYFAQSIKFFIFTPFGINSANYDTGITQGLALMIDPSVLLSIIFLFTFFVVFQYKKQSKKTIFISAMLLGILPQIKIYTAIIAYLAFAIITIYKFIKKLDFFYFKVLTLAACISAFVYVPINFGAGTLVFAPLLLYKHFMESESFLGGNTWILKYQVYTLHNNIFRLAQLYGIALFYFFIPSFGVRLLSIFSAKNLFTKSFYTNENIFLLSLIVFSFLIPSLFIQSSGVFNIVQFLWLAYILLLIPTAFVFEKIFIKNVFLGFFGVLLLILILIPDNFNVLKDYSQNSLVVNNDLFSISQSVKQNVSSNSGLVVLFDNSDLISERPLISALSGHSVYYEKEILEFPNISSIINQRKNLISRIENDSEKCGASSLSEINSILQQTNNQYILTLQKSTCLQHDTFLSIIDSKGIYTLYKY